MRNHSILNTFFFSTIIIVSIYMSCQSSRSMPPEPLLPIPTEQQLAWHDMEMNAFIHFTTNTFTGLEWGYGDESPTIFNPSEFDADQWLSILKETGFKGVILTCKHHDGFCLWPSEYTEHSVKNSPYKDGRGDIVKEVSDACKKYGLKFGVYLSPWDRNHKDYGTPEYITYYRAQLGELFTNYGSIFEMWFDGANGGDGFYGGKREKRRIDGSSYYDWPNTLKLVREIQPDVLFFSDAGPDIRWVGNEKGFAGETNWNTITADTLYAGKAHIEKLLETGSEDGTQWIPNEVDVSIRPGWFYHVEQDSLVKTPEKLFDIYLSSVGRGSVLLLNIPPDKRGLINELDTEVLRRFKHLRDSVFATNLAKKATVKANSCRNQSKIFGPNNLIDGNKNSYWTTDDDVIRSEVEFTFKNPEIISFIQLQEYIKLGQRVKAFEIQVLKNDNWETIAEGTTIGHKRILKIESVETQGLKLIIKDAKACPVLSEVAFY